MRMRAEDLPVAYASDKQIACLIEHLTAIHFNCNSQGHT